MRSMFILDDLVGQRSLITVTYFNFGRCGLIMSRIQKMCFHGSRTVAEEKVGTNLLSNILGIPCTHTVYEKTKSLGHVVVHYLIGNFNTLKDSNTVYGRDKKFSMTCFYCIVYRFVCYINLKTSKM